MTNLHISTHHARHLKLIGIKGAAMMGLLLFFFGTIAPVLFPHLEFRTRCLISGACNSLLLMYTFSSTLFLPYSKDSVKLGYLIFWFCGSILFDIVWEVPLWTIDVVKSTPRMPENAWWGIYWWSYTLSDRLYDQVTPVMVSFEVWWLIGNIPGAVGLVNYRNGKVEQALVLFVICGILQCYNASLYLFMTVYVDNWEPIHPTVLSHFVYWSLNGFWCFSSLTASYIAYDLLIPKLESKKSN
uniref:EXPERA domain-containing protein n=1 Tax=Mucochytrium quahogii TaxID=96639 RepID=A0A7S2RT25_9STRA|mmetsp:Transcript_19679/g.42583  ORF Transcript_19679/g.42583 Transcript_19679/m.42583 type:complete len:242 (+) Transcript_19679:78-803(+)